MQVKWSEQAKRELDVILVYGKDNFGEEVAIKLFETTKEFTFHLAQNPHLGFPEPLLKGRNKVYRSLVIHKHYKIVYYADEKKNTIFIADIWDVRREPIKLLKRIKGK